MRVKGLIKFELINLIEHSQQVLLGNSHLAPKPLTFYDMSPDLGTAGIKCLYFKLISCCWEGHENWTRHYKLRTACFTSGSPLAHTIPSKDMPSSELILLLLVHLLQFMTTPNTNFFMPLISCLNNVLFCFFYNILTLFALLKIMASSLFAQQHWKLLSISWISN